MWAHLQDEARCCEQTVLQQQSQGSVQLELADDKDVKDKAIFNTFRLVDGAKMEKSVSVLMEFNSFHLLPGERILISSLKDFT